MATVDATFCLRTARQKGERSAPVFLRELQRPLPDNEIWVIQLLLLNPGAGSLADPGRWAAPAKLLKGNAHWR